MVAIHQEQVVGYMLYELLKSKLHILNFATSPEFRRCGVGSQMVEKLRLKLTQQRRTGLFLTIRESNLVAQLFFRSQKFRATNVLRGYYEDTGVDGYRFEFDLNQDDWQ